MTQAQKTANTPKQSKGREDFPSRLPCLADGKTYPPASLLVFIAGPDGKVHMLQDNNWPGHKVYVHAAPGALQQVVDDGRLAEALQATVSADFVQQAHRQLSVRFYDLLGLAKKSNFLVAGLDKCVESLQKGKVTTLFVAADAAKNAEKAVELAARKDVPVYRIGDKNGLSGATGVANATVIGLRDKRKHFEILRHAARHMQALQPND